MPILSFPVSTRMLSVSHIAAWPLTIVGSITVATVLRGSAIACRRFSKASTTSRLSLRAGATARHGKCHGTTKADSVDRIPESAVSFLLLVTRDVERIFRHTRRIGWFFRTLKGRRTSFARSNHLYSAPAMDCRRSPEPRYSHHDFHASTVARIGEWRVLGQCGGDRTERTWAKLQGRIRPSSAVTSPTH
jgi:hypothetical protein